MNAFRLFLVFAAAAAFAQGPAIAPKALWEADAARSASRFAPANDGVVAEAGAGAISVFVPGGPAGWPGIGLVPSEGSVGARGGASLEFVRFAAPPYAARGQSRRLAQEALEF